VRVASHRERVKGATPGQIYIYIFKTWS
jgi:hypothetical protein